jgi:hypothetical protein
VAFGNHRPRKPGGHGIREPPDRGGWRGHTWRCRWDRNGFYFCEDYVDGAEPYFTLPAIGIEHLELPIRWPFNDPGYTMFPVLNLAVGGSGGGDPATGAYPADMFVDGYGCGELAARCPAMFKNVAKLRPGTPSASIARPVRGMVSFERRLQKLPTAIYARYDVPA